MRGSLSPGGRSSVGLEGAERSEKAPAPNTRPPVLAVGVRKEGESPVLPLDQIEVHLAHPEIRRDGDVGLLGLTDLVPARADFDIHAARAFADHAIVGGVRAFLLQSLDVKARRWRLNLDVLEAEMDKIIGFPEIEGRFDKPALFLSGADSTYVLPEHRERIKSLFPKARFAKIPGAGHWLHADKPREFEASVRAFFDRT